MRGLRMIGQPEIGIAALARGVGHLLQRIRAIGFRRYARAGRRGGRPG